MRHPLSFITSKIKSAAKFARPSSLSPDNALVTGLAGSMLMLMAMLGWDGYLFMKSYRQHKAVETPPTTINTLSEAELDDALQILNKRAQTFNDFLNKTIPTPSASSTPSL